MVVRIGVRMGIRPAIGGSGDSGRLLQCAKSHGRSRKALQGQGEHDDPQQQCAETEHEGILYREGEHLRQAVPDPLPAACSARSSGSAADVVIESMSRKTPSTPARRPAAARPARAHEVRIIGGQWRRTRLPVADRPGLRPTPDRVRETLFNWLASLAGAGGGELPGWHCVDVFAGTGALGFEAASRGAASVLLCEQDAVLAAQLQATQAKLEARAVRIERGNGIAALARCAPHSLQAVFLDPPFEQPQLYEGALRAAVPGLAEGGVIYLEAARAWSDDELAPFGLKVFRHLKAGAVHAHLLRT